MKEENKEPKAVINILGSCISRDIFHYQKDDGGYRIAKYSNEFDIFHIKDNPMEIDKEKYYNTDISDIMSSFLKRCFYLDITKKTLEYIKEDLGDYLVIDSAVCRFSNIKIGKTSIAYTNKRMQLLSRLNNVHILEVIDYVESVLPIDEMEISLRVFVEEILKLYPLNRIILIDIQSSFFHYDGETIHPFSTPEKWIKQNERMRKAFSVLKELLHGCHIIPMPIAIASDTYHWLNVSVLHYTKEYYNYAFRCIDTIIKKLPIEQEISIIERECTDCSIAYTRTHFTTLAIEYAKYEALFKREKKISSSRDLQAKFFRELCQNGG